LPITDIKSADVPAAVRKIERKGLLESARRTVQLAGAVFRYSVATACHASEPTRDLRGALSAPIVTHYGAIIDPASVVHDRQIARLIRLEADTRPSIGPS
jgi:hypothetical protein